MLKMDWWWVGNDRLAGGWEGKKERRKQEKRKGQGAFQERERRNSLGEEIEMPGKSLWVSCLSLMASLPDKVGCE